MHYIPFEQLILSGWMLESIHIVHSGITIFHVIIFLGRYLAGFNVSVVDYLPATSDGNFLETVALAQW